MTRKSKRAKHLRADALSVVTHLDPLHLQERGRLEGLLPDQQLTVQLHAEEHVLPALRLDTEAVLPLVQEVVVLEETAGYGTGERHRDAASALAR